MDSNLDEQIRVFSKILAIRTNALHPTALTLELGSEYDALVDRASSAFGNDFSEHKIGGDHLTPNGKYYQADLLRARMDGLLNHMKANLPHDPVEKIGF